MQGITLGNVAVYLGHSADLENMSSLDAGSTATFSE